MVPFSFFMEENNLKNPICAILWQDASYSFEKNIPQEIPLPKLTVGFIVETNDNFTNIATNVDYDSRQDKIVPKDGFLIPAKSIVKFQRIGYFNKNEEK
ncbi:MAG: hypothetical protein L6Q29_04320 [Candidatus Pacebacteria bacterium]|nr:hypothetical protein [Candidatus Paceibacterota bacterium]